jgi:uncharacterized protein YcfJ
MLSKAMTGLVASGLLLSGQAAFADHNDWKNARYERRSGPEYDYARVVDVDPIVRQVRVSEPRRECWNETRYDEASYPNDHRYDPKRGSAGSMILGGIIGAAIGNQIGSGDGRRAATVAGAIIGSAVGHDAAAKREARNRYAYEDQDYRESRPYEVERCKVRYEESYEKRVEGYRVTYVYNGREHTTRLPYDPGDRIRVRVDVQPEDYD